MLRLRGWPKGCCTDPAGRTASRLSLRRRTRACVVRRAAVPRLSGSTNPLPSAARACCTGAAGKRGSRTCRLLQHRSLPRRGSSRSRQVTLSFLSRRRRIEENGVRCGQCDKLPLTHLPSPALSLLDSALLASLSTPSLSSTSSSLFLTAATQEKIAALRRQQKRKRDDIYMSHPPPTPLFAAHQLSHCFPATPSFLLSHSTPCHCTPVGGVLGTGTTHLTDPPSPHPLFPRVGVHCRV